MRQLTIKLTLLITVVLTTSIGAGCTRQGAHFAGAVVTGAVIGAAVAAEERARHHRHLHGPYTPQYCGYCD